MPKKLIESRQQDVWLRRIRVQPLISLTFLQALVATLGSLYFSEIVGYAPCKLCWLQRICMYPLVPILFVGFKHKEKHIHEYVLPFSLIGLLIAVYHNIDYYLANYVGAMSSFALPPCSGGVSCTKIQPVLLNIITIPHLSLAAFAIITVLMLLHRKQIMKNSLVIYSAVNKN